MLTLPTVCSHSAKCIYGSVWGVKCVSSFVSANRFVVMEGSVLVGVVREREREAVRERRNSNRTNSGI